jgi:hypothetical protein
MTKYKENIMRVAESKDEDDLKVKNDSPVRLADKKTIFYLFLVAGITILILLLIRFTIL